MIFKSFKNYFQVCFCWSVPLVGCCWSVPLVGCCWSVPLVGCCGLSPPGGLLVRVCCVVAGNGVGVVHTCAGVWWWWCGACCVELLRMPPTSPITWYLVPCTSPHQQTGAHHSANLKKINLVDCTKNFNFQLFFFQHDCVPLVV